MDKNLLLRRSLLAAAGTLLLALHAPHAAAGQVIRLSTTTSTENSGLLAWLLPPFEAKYGARVKVIAVGTGKALELAKNGDVDVTLVHARASEDKFVREGHGVARRDVMYNDFIIVGPAADPAGIRGSRDVLAALRRLHEARAKFISRGDNSGTDLMEKSYWRELAIRPAGSQYVSAGLGMGPVLNMAAELGAYTLTDRATYVAYRAKTGLAVLVEGDRRMFNPYGIIATNPARHPGANHRGALQLIDWIASEEGQRRIASFRPDGQQLFFPSAPPK